MNDPASGPSWGDALRKDGARAIEWAAGYLDRVPDLPVMSTARPGDTAAFLPRSAPEDGEDFGAILADLDRLLPSVTHWQHPRFFAYFATTASPPGILAELLAATLNQVAFVWRTSPIATEMEAVALGWVARMLGLPEAWHGHIEDTASTSTLAALAAAREASGRQVVVCSEQAHSSVEKGARILGMTTRAVPVDEAFRMRPDRAAEALAPGDVAALVATVGTTATASVDPVPRLADLARASGAWLHVDAAYAGASWVCPWMRDTAAGVDRADSLVVNPHKWLYVPMDCSCLWTSRPDDLRRAFRLVPEYLTTPEHAESLSDYGPSLGRRFRALKLWAVLRCYGRRGIEERVGRAIELARTFAGWVADDDDWELAAPPMFSLVCFRRRGSDAANERLLEAVNASGEAFLSHTRVGGRYALRLAVGHERTTRSDVERAWDLVRRLAEADPSGP